MNLQDITPLVLTYNEAPNIARCLDQLTWARDVVVLDSCSTDDTVAIARRYPNVRVFERKFDELAIQWNYGLRQTQIQTEWVLGLDADYVVTQPLRAEIEQLAPTDEVSAYWVPFTYCVYGHPLRGCAYGPVASLFRNQACHVAQDGHAHRLKIDKGEYGPLLQAKMLHDDRKSIAHWLASQSKYMDLEVRKLLNTPRAELSRVDRLRQKIIFAPAAALVYCLFFRGGILDGWPGWFYALQRATSELILSLKLLEQKLLSKPGQGGGP